MLASLAVIGTTAAHVLLRMPKGERASWLLGVLFMGQLIAPLYWWKQPWLVETNGDRCPACDRMLPSAL